MQCLSVLKKEYKITSSGYSTHALGLHIQRYYNGDESIATHQLLHKVIQVTRAILAQGSAKRDSVLVKSFTSSSQFSCVSTCFKRHHLTKPDRLTRKKRMFITIIIHVNEYVASQKPTAESSNWIRA